MSVDHIWCRHLNRLCYQEVASLKTITMKRMLVPGGRETISFANYAAGRATKTREDAGNTFLRPVRRMPNPGKAI